MRIAIDLDDTLITTHPYELDNWRMKKSTMKYLYVIQHHCGAELHLITARQDSSVVEKIVKEIEDKLGVSFKSISVNYGPKVRRAKELGCAYLIDNDKGNFKDKVEDVECIHFGNKKVGYDSWREIYYSLFHQYGL